MKELEKYYTLKLAEFEKLHKKWVQSNENSNSLYEAKSQLTNAGDINIGYAAEVLDKAIKEEKRRNDDLLYRVNVLSRLLSDMECYIKDTFGKELNGVYKVRGY